MKQPQLGDRVRITTKEGTYEGIVLPHPAILKKKILVLKLENGYNIGIDQKKITKIELLEAYTPKKAQKEEALPQKKGLPTIAILSTGGTISSKVDYRTGGVYASYTAKDFVSMFPELGQKFNIIFESIMQMMSEDMTPTHWDQIAQATAKHLNAGVDGVVITHGTDTMHFSSAAISFLLNRTPKPIVFTGSQRSIDRGSSDAFLNLLCAVQFAASKTPGVFIVMHGETDDSFCYAHRGAKVRKMHTTRRDAFQTINDTPFAKVYSDGRIEFGKPQAYVSKTEDKTTLAVQGDCESDVALLKVYPGINPDVIDFYVTQGVKGLVIEGTALGHVPTTLKESSLIPKIEAAIKKGVIVCMTTQCLNGRVNPFVYSNLREVSSRGVLYCEDMLPEVAYIKLRWAFSQCKTADEIKELMLKNIAGELNERILSR